MGLHFLVIVPTIITYWYLTLLLFVSSTACNDSFLGGDIFVSSSTLGDCPHKHVPYCVLFLYPFLCFPFCITQLSAVHGYAPNGHTPSPPSYPFLALRRRSYYCHLHPNVICCIGNSQPWIFPVSLPFPFPSIPSCRSPSLQYLCNY